MLHSSELVPAGDGKGAIVSRILSVLGHSLAEAGKEKQSRGLCATLAEGAHPPWGGPACQPALRNYWVGNM